VAVVDQFAPMEAWCIWYGLDDEPPYDWWTGEAWDAKYKRDAEADARYEAELKASGGNPMAAMYKRLMGGESFMQQILPPTEIKDE
jgi:hypothetical protein